MARASGIFSVTRLMEIEVWQRELDKMLQDSHGQGIEGLCRPPSIGCHPDTESVKEGRLRRGFHQRRQHPLFGSGRIFSRQPTWSWRYCSRLWKCDKIATWRWLFTCRLQDKGCSTCGAKEPHLNLTASLAAVPAAPSEDWCMPGMYQGIPARDQSISTTDPGSTAEVKGICTEDQSIPGKASASPMEGQGVLLTQPAAVDRVLSAIGDDSSVAAGVEAHAGGVSASSAGQGIADELSLVSYRPTHMSIQASPHGHKISSKWHCAGALGGAIPDAVTQHTAPESACATSKVLQQASALEHTLSSKICKKQDTPASGADSSLLTPTSPRCLLAKAAARMQAERADAHSPLTIATDS
ncbi:TPA: hypothetical protein ACH3X1_007956 [Trebouxia sp. C0004]